MTGQLDQKPENPGRHPHERRAPRERARRSLSAAQTLMLVTVLSLLSPVIGYDKASAIAHKAEEEGLSLKETALALGHIDERRFDEIVDARSMVGHGLAGS